MRLLCVGGGSGGHVTPVLAVINELAKHERHLRVMFVCDATFEDQARGIMKNAAVKVDVRVIKAGKFRRYHNTSKIRQLLDIPTVAWNTRDVGRIMAGFWQSTRLIAEFKPDIVFAKGGYVCLPMGYAARLNRTPLVIHDSDTRPGLTNSLLGRFAAAIATGAPLENYSYPLDRTVYTGVPIEEDFHVFNKNEQEHAKGVIGVADINKPLIVVTGGGLGASSINSGVVKAASALVERGYSIYHVTGKRNYASVKASSFSHPAYKVVEFVYKDMPLVLGAADVVISRGSATFLQELAALAKPTIVVPAHHLGDQNKNAATYKKARAVTVLTDEEVVKETILIDAIDQILSQPDTAEQMATRFHGFARPNAAHDVACLINKVHKEQESHNIS